LKVIKNVTNHTSAVSLSHSSWVNVGGACELKSDFPLAGGPWPVKILPGSFWEANTSIAVDFLTNLNRN